jgi:hypothetical protein
VGGGIGGENEDLVGELRKTGSVIDSNVDTCSWNGGEVDQRKEKLKWNCGKEFRLSAS